MEKFCSVSNKVGDWKKLYWTCINDSECSNLFELLLLVNYYLNLAVAGIPI